MLSKELTKEIVRIGNEPKTEKHRFRCYMAFVVECLDLVSGLFSKQPSNWFVTAKKNRDGIASQSEVEDASFDLCNFSKEIGELSEDEIVTTDGAVAYLLLFALYHENANWRPDRADIVMALECFIDKYVEFFGRENEVISLLKKHFTLQQL